MKEQNPGIARARQSVRVLALAAALSQACVTTRAQTNPVIQRMVDSVSTTRLTEHIQALERSGGWYSRVNFTPGNDTAAVYLKQAFDSIPGLTTVEYDTFYISSAGGGLNTKPLVNIVATLRGTGDASRVFIAGAHLDCSGSRMGSSAWNSHWQTMRVPGADDNATGLAAVLEMARIMSDTAFGFRPEHTVRFIAFGAEESGPAYSGSHHGSKHYADAATSAGQNVIGMVSIDMIGYNPSYLYQSVITNASSTSLAAKFAVAAAGYAPQLLINTTNDVTANYSDHDSFWNDGFTAICMMENAPPWNSNAYYQANPFYHKTSDTSGTVNVDLVRQVTRMSLAAIAAVAGPTGVPAPVRAPLPGQFAVVQNYPNPFNSSTEIRYCIPAGPGGRAVSGPVRLAVYDLLGREVAVLVNERQAPGTFSVSFDASGLAGGSYLCRLMAGKFVATQRLLLLK